MPVKGIFLRKMESGAAYWNYWTSSTLATWSTPPSSTVLTSVAGSYLFPLLMSLLCQSPPETSCLTKTKSKVSNLANKVLWDKSSSPPHPQSLGLLLLPSLPIVSIPATLSSLFIIPAQHPLTSRPWFFIFSLPEVLIGPGIHIPCSHLL